jgi:hypothetical protein
VEEAVVEAEKYSAVDQQVQHLNHFLFISIICYFFYLSHFFTLPLHQILGSIADDVGEVVVEAAKYPAADQLVQHLRFFYSPQSFFVISISLIFYNVSPSVFWKQCW